VEQWEITVEGPDATEDLEALVEWLGAEPQLRGLIKPAPAVPAEGELGGLPTTLIAEAVGSGGALSALAMSLKSFFGQPRGSKVRVTVKRPDGTTFDMDLDRVRKKSVAELTAQLLSAADAGDAANTADAAETPEP
jgi:hypothetical protein